MSERLNKVLAQHGIGSRREVERWIVEGRLQLNNVAAQLGDRFTEGDHVSLDGRDITKRLITRANIQVLAYHKPQGQLIERGESDGTITDVDSGETVMERLPKQRGVRWVAINPMHGGDSGLLLFTNDGALSYALTRQKKQIPTVYMVRVHVRGGLESAPKLSTRLMMDDHIIEFTAVEPTSGEGDNVWYKVSMPRADKRAAVRALFVSNNLTISRMMQVAFADIELTKEMPRSRHQALKPGQIDSLYRHAKLAAPVKVTGQWSQSTASDEEEKTKPRPGKRERLRQRDDAGRSIAAVKAHSKRSTANRVPGAVKRTSGASSFKSKSSRSSRSTQFRK